ncbi:phage tail tape measure protein [Dehalobacter sp. MCB1]|uniref:phage tail tape measure protein n=1 Tax=Dehalobacter sp. MCB1 TaxID=1844756 RepID=UPI001FA9AB5C|nr:phage tail tape measure protein [Dehalobacter sp. MCB1]
MANVTAIMGGSEAEMQAMSAAARDAGSTTQYSATQAAEALSYMAGAGWNSTQATAGLKDTLTMAAAGGMDLAAAGDLMTGTISQFSLQATDADRVSNVLAAGASATNTSIRQLGAGMNEVGSTANAFGMNLEETTAALGALSNANIKGAEGGTALRGILAGLAMQSGPAAAALSELGLSAADVSPETNELSDTMELLQDRGMTATQAIAIFGRENVSAATYLAAHSSELDGLQTSITGTSKASEMAAIQTNTYQGAMGELSSAVEEAQISLGDALLPSLTSGVQLFTEFVQVGTAAGEALYDFAGDVSTALDPVKEAFSYTPMGFVAGAVSDTASSVWGDLKEWAGIGDEAGSAVAEGVAGNEDLATAPADAMISNAAKTATEEAADTFGDDYLKAIKDSKVSKELATYIASGFSDGEALAAYNNQNSAANDEYVRSFEYLGKQITLSLQKGGSGWFDAWKVGDTQMGSTQQGGEFYDPVAAFEMLFGVPAPEQCTAEYYDLIGDSITARKIELKEEMANGTEFDYTGISAIFGDQFVSRLENEGGRIAATASDEVQNTYQSLLDALKEPTWDNLDEVLSQMDSLVADHELDPSEGALLADRYRETLVAGITDIGEFAKDKAASAGDTISNAFEDHFLSIDEKRAISALDPMLDAIKAESPKAFGGSGLAGIAKFIEMVESGASSSDLEAYFSSLGTKAGNSFAEALGIAFEEPDFNWYRIFDEQLASTLGDSNLVSFRENMVQPEVIEQASRALELWNKGVPEFQDYAEKIINSFEEVAEANEWVFTDEQRRALTEYKNEQIGEITLLEIMANKTEKLAKETKKFADEEEDACTECGKLLSAFGAWQEYTAAPYIFRTSYIGPSYGSEGEAYTAGKWADDILRDVNNGLTAIGSPEYDVAVRVKTTLADESKNAYGDPQTARGLLKDLLGVDPEGGEKYNVDFTVNVQTNTAKINLEEIISQLDDINLKANEVPPVERTITFKEASSGSTLGLDGWINSKEDEAAQNPVTATLALDTVAAMSEFEAFRATIEDATITTTLKTEVIQPITEESTKYKTISFKTATPGLGTQTGVGAQDSSSGILQSIFLGQTQNTNRLVAALNSNGASDRTLIRTNTSTISTAVANASSTITSAVNNGATAIVQAIQDMSNGCGSGINVGSIGGSSSSESYFSTTVAGSSSFSGYSSLSYAGFSEGGYADRPTFAMVGDSPGGEYMVPAEKLDNFLMGMSQSNASVGLSLDSSTLQEQLQQAVRSISVPAIPVPVKLSFDSEAIKSQLTSILYDIFAEMR